MLTPHHAQIKTLIEKLLEQYKAKDTEFQAFQKEHRIQMGGPRRA
jgi:hypothetical protein